METTMDYVVCAVLIGAGATAVMDIWTVVRKQMFGIPFGYALVGRWVAYLARGRFRHDPVAATPAVPGERLIGWTATMRSASPSRPSCSPSGASTGLA